MITRASSASLNKDLLRVYQVCCSPLLDQSASSSRSFILEMIHCGSATVDFVGDGIRPLTGNKGLRG